MFENNKVLVTGGTGFVGVNLLRRLLEIKDVNITATLHEKAPVLVDDRIKYIRCNLCKMEDCHKVVQNIDYVFMCAAETAGAAIMEKMPIVHLAPNILMNISMLQAAYEARVKKFLFISSSIVYPVTDFPVQEDDVTNEFYEKYFIDGWMKRFTEIACEMYATKIKDPMKIVVVRPANLYGEYDNFNLETSHVIPALIRKVVERHNPIEVWGDGNDLKEFLHIQDFVNGMLLAMKKLDWFEPINIATGKSYTIREVLQIILNVDRYRDAQIVFNTSKPTMISKRLMDTTKAKLQLEFEAKISLEEGIRRTVEWYRHMKNLPIPAV